MWSLKQFHLLRARRRPARRLNPPGDGVKADWPEKDCELKEAEVGELQKALTKLGFDAGEIDGKPGEAPRAAARKYQEKEGLPLEGYATVALLKRVMAGG